MQCKFKQLILVKLIFYKNNSMKDLKNIIFDLGGVLLQLEMERTKVAFQALAGGKKEFEKLSEIFASQQVFENFEVNKIGEKEFVEAFQKNLEHPITVAQLETAWNAMLLNFPKQNLQLLEELREKDYRIFLLSNTNSIHLRAFRQNLLEEHGIEDFDAFFEKAYYSHLIELRKPHAAAFQFILDDMNLAANETLFIDDNAPNLLGARQIGIHTLWHQPNADIYTQLKRYLQI